jgi:hypothetical protein
MPATDISAPKTIAAPVSPVLSASPPPMHGAIIMTP